MAFKNKQFQHYLWFALVLVLGLGETPAFGRPLDDHTNLSMKERHELWVARHGRVYKDLVEKERRFNIFKENVERIESFNGNASLNNSFRLGVNAFADLTTEEFVATHTGYKKQIRSKSMSNMFTTNQTNGFMYKDVNTDMLPDSLDWRTREAVTPVKDQGQCGCCWAFSSVAAIEGINQIKTRNLVPLSEQQLLDCDQESNGCDGGSMTSAFEYVMRSQGLLTEKEYPFEGMQTQCQVMSSGGGGGYSAVTINNYESVPQFDEVALMQAVSQQPVSVAIDGSGFAFQNYKGGVFQGECSQQELNHAVTLIGYGTDNEGMKYWLVKNSWGETWGENGYIKLIRGQNQCGVASQATYPTME